MARCRWSAVVLLFVLISTSNVNSFLFNNNQITDNGGGTACAACTIVIGLLEQMTLIHTTPIDDLLDKICSSICDFYVNKYGEQVIALIEAKETPDSVCHEIGICTDASCVLFPPPKSSANKITPKLTMKVVNPSIKLGNIKEEENPWDWIKDLINRLANGHQPVEDLDVDNFSGDVAGLRGWNWKGRDCNDLDKKVHPGVLNTDGSAMSLTIEKAKIDWNCNGILGIDPATKLSYEELLCSNSSQRGLIVVGDSFGAHFEIPPSYMNASEINNQTYADLLSVLENEFDWPQRSGFTGFEENTTTIPIDSFYKRLRARNLCNHRDYQNVGVNGARSGAMASNVIESIARNQTDTPVLLVFELIGNDICSPHPDLGQMTTPEQFKVNILASLEYLEKTLPLGSHIVFIGLADGRALWDSLYNRTHPIGVPYVSVYNFLNCLQISPCWVWMNDNETVRNAGAQRALELNNVYNEIIGNYTYNNFDMVYYDFPFAQINQIWQSMGGQTWQLIEPVDGFHPNQVAHALIAQYLWNQLETDHPDFLGPINPNNNLITKLFGDQGGY